jgi:hypothetical protein
MDQLTIENWKKIKEGLERANKIDCDYYKRACAILKSGKDPMENPFTFNT